MKRRVKTMSDEEKPPGELIPAGSNGAQVSRLISYPCHISAEIPD